MIITMEINNGLFVNLEELVFNLKKPIKICNLTDSLYLLDKVYVVGYQSPDSVNFFKPGFKTDTFFETQTFKYIFSATQLNYLDEIVNSVDYIIVDELQFRAMSGLEYRGKALLPKLDYPYENNYGQKIYPITEILKY